MIVATEIGDKTFFIAAVLTMRHSRRTVWTGAVGALALMTVSRPQLPPSVWVRWTHRVSCLTSPVHPPWRAALLTWDLAPPPCRSSRLSWATLHRSCCRPRSPTTPPSSCSCFSVSGCSGALHTTQYRLLTTFRMLKRPPPRYTIAQHAHLIWASPRLASPRLASPRLASPRLALPRLASPRLASPRLASPRLALPRLASA